MAVQEDNYVLSTEEDCSSGDDDFSTDSELELGDLNSTDENDSSEFEKESPRINKRTNSSSLGAYRNDVFITPYTCCTQHIVNHDIIDEGLRLYIIFLEQEIVKNCLQTPEYLHSENRSMPKNMNSLREVANHFSTSLQRKWIRQQAQIVSLNSLSFRSFTDILVGLFQGARVTWKRILVLFFFCADISVRALQESLTHQFRRIQSWAARFIEETVCRWVEMEGGWGAIFQQSLNHATKIAILGFCCVGIIALCIYIRRNAIK